MTDLAIQELLDKQALYELAVRYCRAVDRADAELLLSVYHDDAIDDHGPFVGGAVDFLEFMSDGTMNPERRPLPVQHSISNAVFDVRGDQAFGELYVEVRRVDEHGGMFIEGFARWVDRYERRAGEWRIAHRRVLLEYAAPGGRHSMDDFLAGTRDRHDPSYDREPAVPRPSSDGRR